MILVSLDMSRGGAQRRCSVLFEDVVEICTKSSITNEIFGETTHPSVDVANDLNFFVSSLMKKL